MEEKENLAPIQGVMRDVCHPGAALRLPLATRCRTFGAEEALALYRWMFGWASLCLGGANGRLSASSGALGGLGAIRTKG